MITKIRLFFSALFFLSFGSLFAQNLDYSRYQLYLKLRDAAYAQRADLEGKISNVYDKNNNPTGTQWHFDFSYNIAQGNPGNFPGMAYSREPNHIYNLIDAYIELGNGHETLLLTAFRAINRLLDWRDDHRRYLDGTTHYSHYSDMEGDTRFLWRNIDFQKEHSLGLANDNNRWVTTDLAFYADHTPIVQGAILRPMTYLLRTIQLDPWNANLATYLKNADPTCDVAILAPKVKASIDDAIIALLYRKLVTIQNTPVSKDAVVAWGFDKEVVYSRMVPQILTLVPLTFFSYYDNLGSGRFLKPTGCGHHTGCPNPHHQGQFANHVPYNQQNILAEAILYLAEYYYYIDPSSGNYADYRDPAKELSLYFRSMVYKHSCEDPVINSAYCAGDYLYWSYKGYFNRFHEWDPNDVGHSLDDIRYVARDFTMNREIDLNDLHEYKPENFMFQIGNSVKHLFSEYKLGKLNYRENWGNTNSFRSEVNDEFLASSWLEYTPFVDDFYTEIVTDFVNPALQHLDLGARKNLYSYVPFWEEHPPFVPAFGGSVDYKGITSGDFNGDGYDDLAVYMENTQTGIANKIMVFTSNGSCFSYWDSFTWGDADFAGIAAGSINGDGYDDIVVITEGSSSSLAVDHVQSFLGGSTAGMGSRVGSGITWNGVSRGYVHVAVGNLDGDPNNFDEVAIVKDGGSGTVNNMIKVFDNVGGTLQLGPSIVWGGREFYSLTAGDFDNDGSDELAIHKRHDNIKAPATYSPNNMIKMFEFDGSGTALVPGESFIYGDLEVKQLIAGDFNGDGWDDWALVREEHPDKNAQYNNNVQILYSHRKTYTVGTSFAYEHNSTPFLFAAAGNFNHSDFRKGDDVAVIQISEVPGSSINNSIKVFISGYEQMNCEGEPSGVIYYDDGVNGGGGGQRISKKEIDTGIEDLNPEKNTISIYPSPSRGRVVLDFGISTSGTYELFTSNGSVVQSGDIESAEQVVLELSGLNKGLYFIRIHANQDTPIVEKISLY